MPNLRCEMTEDGLCVLTFDRPNSSANIFDRATLDELAAHLETLEKPDPTLRGVVFLSAKNSIFIAGADLHAVKKMCREEMLEFITLGQNLFSRIAALPVPSVAAIHGAAVGGGYEICLACDYRVASPDRSTKIGLPETKLGIIPAWGGCTRLPRLIGVPRALDIILGGKTVAAKHALKLGMIDDLAPRESLLAAARRLLARGRSKHHLAHSAAVNAVVDAVIAHKARADVKARTRGHYPAVTRALEVILAGATHWSESDSLARERAAVSDLIGSETTRRLMELFFLQERAKQMRSTGILPVGPAGVPPAATPHRRQDARGPHSLEGCATACTVIGAGVMGAGIAQWLSTRGLPVLLRDIDTTRLAAGMAGIARLNAEAVKHRVLTPIEAQTAFDRISASAGEVPLHRCDIVIEAAVEKMPVKQSIFRRLDELTREDTILATNTSALSITALAHATRHPARVVGIHFFNPVHKMQLVEVVLGADTSPETAQRAVAFVQQIGKLPVVVKDSPGFLVNRILLPSMIEAAELFASGASAEDIDEAMLDFGMPMGPLRLIDEVGVDIAADVAATLAAAFPERLRVPAILTGMSEAGLLGRKVGKGFYLHPRDSDPVPNPEAAGLRSADKGGKHSREELQRRMVLLMVNEAARCVEEGIVASPADVDFAMVMGTGFAPFRGGPLRYSDTLGAAHVVEALERLSRDGGPHFAPCRLLIEHAQTHARFYED